MGKLVVMMVLCPVMTFPVEQVTGVALLTAAKSNFRIISNVLCQCIRRRWSQEKCVSFAWRETFSRVSSMCVGIWDCTYSVPRASCVIPFMMCT